MIKNQAIERMTQQRRIILEEIQKPGRHFSADEVFTVVRQRIPNISLATVYRNLEVLVQAGRITQFVTSDGLRRYDVGPQRHYHLHCVKCGRIWDLSADLFPNFEAIAKGTSGFRILGHVLEFEGICRNCSESAVSGSAPEKEIYTKKHLLDISQ